MQKPGQASAGSGTTPTLMGDGLVAITDNADPMNVLVYRRGSGALICRQPVFAKGASATDQSLIGTGRSLVVENNYGYSGPAATQGGKTTSPGLERVDLDAGGGCHTAWRSAERAPSVVPKLSARNGLVYTYTKDPQPSNADAWYLTALDFGSGATVYKRLGGEGLGFNNNYAPVTLGPDGTAYVGTLGGLVALRDKTPPPGRCSRRAGPEAKAKLRRMRLHVRRLGRKRARVWLMGGGTRQVRRVDFMRGKRRLARDRRRPFVRIVRVGPRRVRLRARIVLRDGRRVARARRRDAGSRTERRPRVRVLRHERRRLARNGSPRWTVTAHAGPFPQCAVAVHRQKPPDRRVRLPRRLELRHVPAVELEVLRARQRLAHVARERDRDEAVLPAPHEQRLVLAARAAGSRSPRCPPARRGRCCAARRRTRRGRAACMYARRNSSTPTADQPSRPPGTKRRTTSSITGRGVICSSPSSGRSAFTSGVHGRPRSHASDGVSPTIRPTRAGLRKPTSNATRPPIELPIRCARSIPQASMNPQTARAKKCGS